MGLGWFVSGGSKTSGAGQSTTPAAGWPWSREPGEGSERERPGRPANQSLPRIALRRPMACDSRARSRGRCPTAQAGGPCRPCTPPLRRGSMNVRNVHAVRDSNPQQPDVQSGALTSSFERLVNDKPQDRVPRFEPGCGTDERQGGSPLTSAARPMADAISNRERGRGKRFTPNSDSITVNLRLAAAVGSIRIHFPRRGSSAVRAIAS